MTRLLYVVRVENGCPAIVLGAAGRHRPSRGCGQGHPSLDERPRRVRGPGVLRAVRLLHGFGLERAIRPAMGLLCLTSHEAAANLLANLYSHHHRRRGARAVGYLAAVRIRGRMATTRPC